MANFEGLIRQALAKQNADDPAIRAKVYQSSRNALQRMIEKAANLPDGAAEQQLASLEASIETIEEEFSKPASQSAPLDAQQADNLISSVEPPAPDPVEPTPPPAYESDVVPKPMPLPDPIAAPMQEPVAAPVPTPDPVVSTAPDFEPAASTLQTTSQTTPSSLPDVEVASQYSEIQQLASEPEKAPVSVGLENLDYQEPADSELPPEDFASNYRSKRRLSYRLLGFLGILLIVAITLGLGYLLFNTLAGNNETTNQAVRERPLDNPNSPKIISSETPGSYISILDPANPSPIVANGRGEVSIVDNSGEKALRITSLRPDSKRSEVAAPMLLQIKPGVLKQIEGQKVTFVIEAKSGAATRSQFTVQCQFGGLGSCGRKRFPVGIQPEKAVFSVEMADNIPEDTKAYLAINTDVTSAAGITGKGDVLDILSVRVGLPE